jgi:hypothetical protein
MKLTTYKSKKLFYKKYLYKISFQITLGSIFRTYEQTSDQLEFALAKINEYKDELEIKSKRYKDKSKVSIDIGFYTKHQVRFEDIEAATILRNSLLELNYMLRHDYSNVLSIYTNEYQPLLESIKKIKNLDFIDFYEPDPAILNNNSADVLVSAHAKDFSYKVTLNIGSARAKHSSVINWITANRDKIKITNYSLDTAYSNIGVYVRDDKVLMLLQMTGGDYVKKIERLISPS